MGRGTCSQVITAPLTHIFIQLNAARTHTSTEGSTTLSSPTRTLTLVSPIPVPFAGLPKLPSSLSAPSSAALSTLLSRPSIKSLATPRKSRTVPIGSSSVPWPSPSSSIASSSDLSPQKLRLPAQEHQRPSTPETPRTETTLPQTPTTTSRRSALLERIRNKSLQNTPSSSSSPLGEKDMSKWARQADSEAIKRRCLLARLPAIADSMWMMFSSAAPNSPSSAPTTPTRRRRAIPLQDVVSVVVKSSRNPLSACKSSSL